MSASRRVSLVLLMVLCLAPASQLFSEDPKKFTSYDRQFVNDALKVLQDDISKHYYDPKFHGVDLDATFRHAAEQVKAVDSLNQALSDIAAALASLNDSHTFFTPPPRPYIHDYGWRMKFFGDNGAFITAVRPGSDAEKQGIKPGDQILAINGYQVDRHNFWKMEYVYWTLRPQPALALQLRSPDGSTRQVTPQAYFRDTKKVADITGDNSWDFIREGENDERSRRIRLQENHDVIIVNIPDFAFDPDQADTILNRIKSPPAVVFDLRGNPGGYEKSLANLAGGFFDHDVKIADRVGRKTNLKPTLAKTHGHPYTGKLFVLIDSKRASAAELFARVMQIEHRATIIGDRSSGDVMEALRYHHKSGIDTVIFYGASITEADLIMSDGKSLEHTGVIPDYPLLPTAADLAAGRDPVLAYAVTQAGGTLTPEQAGTMFPLEWPHH
jgi:C-terminal processing protease CtpA/Prc